MFGYLYGNQQNISLRKSFGILQQGGNTKQPAAANPPWLGQQQTGDDAAGQRAFGNS